MLQHFALASHPAYGVSITGSLPAPHQLAAASTKRNSELKLQEETATQLNVLSCAACHFQGIVQLCHGRGEGSGDGKVRQGLGREEGGWSTSAPEGSQSHASNILAVQVGCAGVVAGSPYLLVLQYWDCIVTNDGLHMCSQSPLLTQQQHDAEEHRIR